MISTMIQVDVVVDFVSRQVVNLCKSTRNSYQFRIFINTFFRKKIVRLHSMKTRAIHSLLLFCRVEKLHLI